MAAYVGPNPNHNGDETHGRQARNRTCCWGGVGSVCAHWIGASSRGSNRLLRLGSGLLGCKLSNATLAVSAFVATSCTKLLKISSAADVTPNPCVRSCSSPSLSLSRVAGTIDCEGVAMTLRDLWHMEGLVLRFMTTSSECSVLFTFARFSLVAFAAREYT